MVTVRPVSPLDDLVSLGTGHGADTDTPRRRRSVVAESSGSIVGAATLGWSVRHPDIVFAHVDIASSVGSDVTEALLRGLHALADRPLVFNLEIEDPLVALLTADGFQPVVASTTVRFAVADAIEALAHRGAARPGEFEFTASQSVSTEVATWYDRVYAARHAWAGRYTPPNDEPWIMFAGPTVDVEAAVQVATLAGEVVAATSLHRGPFAVDPDAFLPPTSVLADVELDGRAALLGTLLYNTLLAAARAGIVRVNAEYDTPYDDLAALITALPATTVSSRQIWMRDT